MHKLRILLLGPPEIYQEGQPLRITRRNTRYLLFYLACRRGMVARDELAFLFWGDTPDEVARQRLRETISRLRKSLANPDWVRILPDLVGIDFNSVYVDLHEFYTLTDQTFPLANRIPLDQPLPQPLYNKITKAISLWRTPNCLAGTILSGSYELERWFTNQANQLEQTYLNLLERISYHSLVATELEQCLHYARQGLSVDDSQESFHYIILRALLSMGRSAQAREHYHTYILRLEQEGNSLTNPLLQELIQQLKGTTSSDPGATIQSHWTLRPTKQLPFVGRQPLLDKLWKQFQSGGGALIMGEPGQGKTHLLEQFSGQVAPVARILTSNCRASENQLTLQPLIDLLREHFEERDWLAIPATWAAQLTRIFPEIIELRPELRQLYGDAYFNQETQADQANLLEALRQTFWAIAQGRKLLVCINDIHWADETTLTALTYFMERPPFTEQSIILLTARIDERHPYFAHLENYFRRSPRCTVLEMSGLDLDETRSLISYLLAGNPTEAFTQKIHADSGGNPLYILETVRTVLEQGIDPANDQIETIPVPNHIIRLIQQRLDDLSQPERNLVEFAAIYGTEFDPAVIQDASEYKLDQFAIYLNQLTERQLIEPVTEASDGLCYRFIHSKFREVLLDAIPDLRRRWLHRQVGNALSRHPVLPYNHPAILAEHFEKSGDPATAFQFWILAAQHARRLQSISEALKHFAQAEQQLAQATNITTRQVYEFYSEWSKLAYEIDEIDLVQRISEAMLRSGYDRRSDLLIGTAYDSLSDAYILQKKYDKALETNHQAASFLERTGHSLAIMQMYNRRGSYLFLLNRYVEASAALQSALEQPGDDKDPFYLHTVANTHKLLAMITMQSGWPSKSIYHAHRAEEYYRIVRDPYGKVSVYNLLALAQYYLGDYQAARRNCEVGIESAENIHAWRLLGHLYSHAAQIDLAMGNLDSALSNARQTIQIGEERGHFELVALGNHLIGNIFTWLLDYSAAYEYYQSGLNSNQNTFLSSNLVFLVGFAQSLIENYHSGMETHEQVIQKTIEQEDNLQAILSKLSMTRVLYEKGQYQEVREIASDLAEEALLREIKYIYIAAQMFIFIIDLRNGKADGQDLTLKRIIQDAQKLSNSLLELLIVIEYVKARPQTQTPFPFDTTRITQLLNELDNQTQDPLIRPAFLSFRDLLKICEEST